MLNFISGKTRQKRDTDQFTRASAKKLRDVKFYIWQNKTETRYRPVYESKCKEVYNETTKNQTEVCERVLVANESYEVDVSGWIPYKPGMDLEPGTGRWRLEAKRPANKKVDFILEAHGKEFTEWAWWDDAWKYRREISNLTGYISYLNINRLYFLLEYFIRFRHASRFRRFEVH